MDNKILSGKTTTSLGIQCNLSFFNKENPENQVSVTTNKFEYFIAESEITDSGFNLEVKREIKTIEGVDQEQQTEDISLKSIKKSLKEYKKQLCIALKDKKDSQLISILDQLDSILRSKLVYHPEIDYKPLAAILERIDQAGNQILYKVQCSRLSIVIKNLLKKIDDQLIQDGELELLVKQEIVSITAEHIKEVFTELQDCFTVIHFIYKAKEQIAAEFLDGATTTLESIYLTCSTANTIAKAELTLVIDTVTNDNTLIDISLLLTDIAKKLTDIINQYKIEIQHLALVEVKKSDFSSSLKTNEVVNLYLFCLALQFYARLKNLSFEEGLDVNKYDLVKSSLKEITYCLETASLYYQISYTNQLIQLFKIWVAQDSIKDLQEFADEALSPYIVNHIGLIYNNPSTNHLENNVLTKFQSLVLWNSFFELWDINEAMQELEQFQQE